MKMNKILMVIGGSGFIGSHFIDHVISKDFKIINVDKISYASNLHYCKSSSKMTFYKIDISSYRAINELIYKIKPQIIVNFAAESHVDRSIDDPNIFIKSNINGTTNILVSILKNRNEILKNNKNFKYIHISTDEVYGDLGETGLFTEETSYEPSSPYSASKAASDHLVRAWYRTYGLPVVVTNCSNNYGPYHFPEKLIPLIILNALEGKALPIYGDGKQVRDWLFVEDHARALYKVVSEGRLGETYNIGGFNEKQNIEVVQTICNHLNSLITDKPKGLTDFNELITFVKDRPGHDVRYAIDANKINKELGWHPEETFESGIKKTIEWYLTNSKWCEHVQDGSYQRERLGK
jgi:dTDP-glucose 4,6-dehydratase